MVTWIRPRFQARGRFLTQNYAISFIFNLVDGRSITLSYFNRRVPLATRFHEKKGSGVDPSTPYTTYFVCDISDTFSTRV